jgi:hypothetical protein
VKQKLEKWQGDIARIRNAVVRLLDHRRWNRVYEAIVSANPQLRPGMPVLDYFHNVYADYAVMAIRRQVRADDDSVSLVGLLEDVAENSSFITRAWTRQLYERPLTNGERYPQQMAHMLADGAFTQFADSAGARLDETIVRNDIERLRGATSKILGHSDRAVAHDDRRGARDPATFDDLNLAIDMIEEIAKRYLLLLTGESMIQMTPIDVTNSIGVFRFTWIDPDHPPQLGKETL